MVRANANFYCFLIVMLMWCQLHSTRTDAKVVILNQDDHDNGTTCECGRTVTLTCKLETYTFGMEWMNQNDITTIAQCIHNSCKLNPAFDEQYTFSSDMTHGIFNLTIIKVSKKDNGRGFVCSDGSNFDSIILKVTDNVPQLFEDTVKGTIMATSGCTSQDSNINFKWIVVNGDNSNEEEIQPKRIVTNRTLCYNDSECGQNNQSQYTEEISFEASNDGKYLLKVAVLYGNERKKSHSTALKYIIEEQVADEDNSDGRNSIMIAVVVCFSLTFGVIVVCIVKICRTCRKYEKRIEWVYYLSLINIQNRKHEEERSECEHTFHTSDVAKFADGDEKTPLRSFQHKSRSEEDLSSVTVIDIIDHEQKDNDVEPVKGILPSPNLMKTVSHKSNSVNELQSDTVKEFRVQDDVSKPTALKTRSMDRKMIIIQTSR